MSFRITQIPVLFPKLIHRGSLEMPYASALFLNKQVLTVVVYNKRQQVPSSTPDWPSLCCVMICQHESRVNRKGLILKGSRGELSSFHYRTRQHIALGWLPFVQYTIGGCCLWSGVHYRREQCLLTVPSLAVCVKPGFVTPDASSAPDIMPCSVQCSFTFLLVLPYAKTTLSVAPLC